MRFEARELKPYAEPVTINDLKGGGLYFSITFLDNEMHVPIIDTLVFLSGDDDGFLKFQDAESHFQGVRSEQASDANPVRIYRCAPTELNNVFEYEHALDLLLQCSLRRRNLV